MGGEMMKKILNLFLLILFITISITGLNINCINAHADTQNVMPLSFNVTDSAINPDQSIIYLSDMADKKLYELNYETGNEREITFDLPPERITYANGKIYVCLLKGQHSYYWWDANQNGAFAVIDAVTFTKINQFDIQLDPYDIAADNQGHVFISGGSGQITRIVSYNDQSGEVISTVGSACQGSFIEVNSKLNKLYCIDNNVSPIDTFQYPISNGVISAGYDSPYHGDYSMKPNFRISPDGLYDINSSGNVFYCSNAKEKDLRFAYNLGSCINDIAFDLPNNRFFTCDNTKQINVYEYEFFGKTGTVNTLNTPKTIYFSNGKIVAVSLDSNNKFCIENISLANIAPVLPVNTNGIILKGDITNTVYDNVNNRAYSLDKAFNHLFIIDLNTRQIINTIKLPYRPSSLCISEDRTKLYIANNDISYPITEVDINTGTILRSANYTTQPDCYDFVDRHIYNKGNKIYLIGGEWAPQLYVFDASTFNYIATPLGEGGVGDIAISPDNNYLYYWYQYGWSAGIGNSYVYKYSISSDTYIKVDQSSLYLNRDPLDTPIILQSDKDSLILKGYVFKSSSLNTVVNLYPEPIYAINADFNIAVGKAGIYDLTTGNKIVNANFTGAKSFFFDKNGTLFFVKNNILTPYELTNIIVNSTQLNIYTDDTYQIEAKALYSDGTVSDITAKAFYSSNNTAVASVSAAGVIKANSSGNAQITVQYCGKSLIIGVTVNNAKPDPPVITVPVNDAITNNNEVVVSGTSAPLATVYVNFEDNVTWHPVKADSNGNWSYTPITPIKDGTYIIEAKVIGDNGIESDLSNGERVTIDTVAPAPPDLNFPQNGISISSHTPTLFGTSERNAKIHINIDDKYSGDVKTLPGSICWSATLQNLNEGNHTITLTAEDAAGNISALTSPYAVTVAMGSASQLIVGIPADNIITSSNSPYISGSADPGSLIDVYIDGGKINTTSVTADVNGYWYYTPESAISDGNHTITAKSTLNGQNLDSNKVNIVIDTIANAPVIITPINQSSTNKNIITISGKAEAYSTIFVYINNDKSDLIAYYIGIVNADGTWNCNAALYGDGDYYITSKIRDIVNNSSSLCNPVKFTIDTVRPIITLNGPGEIKISKGSAFTDPGVTVTDDKDTNIAASASGTVNTAVTGTYILTYNAHDAAGNAASPVTRAVTVYENPPQDTVKPVITLNGASTITINKGDNFTDPGATVTDNKDTNLTATVSGTVNTSVANTYKLTYSATDSAGNAAIPVIRTVIVIEPVQPQPPTGGGGVGGGIPMAPKPEAPKVTAEDDINIILGINNTMEYSINGLPYVSYNADSLPDLSGSKMVKVRVKAQGMIPASDDVILNFTTNPVKPDIPRVTADDNLNVIVGIDGTMEYSIDGQPYTAYNASQLPDLSGDKTVKVRIKAKDTNPASDDAVLKFTINPVKPDAPKVTADDNNNRINGIDGTMEYSIDGQPYVEYNASRLPDLSGDKTVKVRIMTKDTNPASDDAVLRFTTNPVKPDAPKVTADDIDNRINGIDDTMEYSINGQPYVPYSASTPIGLSGDKSVRVRVKVNGINPPSDDTVLTFTINPVKSSDANKVVGGKIQVPLGKAKGKPSLPVIDKASVPVVKQISTKLGKGISVIYNKVINIKTLTVNQIKITDGKGKRVKFTITYLTDLLGKTHFVITPVNQKSLAGLTISFSNVKDKTGKALPASSIKVK